MDDKGRGAFTSVGKDNGQPFYTYKKALPQDGLTPEKGFNYEAVHLGVLSIENRLVQLGFRVKIDGIFGPGVESAIREFQARNGLTVSGEIGFNTGAALFKDVIAGVGKSYPFPPSLIWGLMKAESGGDPGAVGYDTPNDRGLYQFNTSYPGVDKFQAHDFDLSTEVVFTRFMGAWKKYMGKGPELRTNCSIMQHKSPLAAEQWFKNGIPTDDVCANYVSRVKGFALTY